MYRFTVLMLIVFWSVSSAWAENNQTKIATMYKTPQCRCCDGHAAYLRKHGFKVKVIPSKTLDEINLKAGIPEDYQGCHTTFIDGYAVSGHVPIGPIQKLLSERPDVKGIALPGMPSGSPGMDGPKEGEWTIYSLSDGKAAEYTKY